MQTADIVSDEIIIAQKSNCIIQQVHAFMYVYQIYFRENDINAG